MPLLDESQIRVLLLDIEGTTTPVDFVYQTLFPYASRKLESFLWELRSSAAFGQWLIARDSKCTPLKSLQGKIWQQGFTSGELRGDVYPDVPVAFERWRRQKKIICIYSSGSVLAQQLLFRTTVSGDLTSYISAFFDTRVGAKTEGESYKKIATSISFAPCQFLFISDAVKEIAAAQSVGMQAILCDRDRRASSSPTAGGIIRSLDSVLPD